ncbi:MAG: PrpR N-terminal domain-containing protein [Desulfitobacteriaceae bacterium]
MPLWPHIKSWLNWHPQVWREENIEAKIVVGGMAEGVNAARELISQGVEVLISRGGTASAIAQEIEVPVVRIPF